MSAMDALLDAVTDWLADHPWATTVLLCAGILLVFAIDGPNASRIENESDVSAGVVGALSAAKE